MTDWQAILIVALLAGIASALYTISTQLERLIRVMVHQRERLEHSLCHPDDDQIRFQLRVFLEEANKETHLATKESLEARLSALGESARNRSGGER